MFLTHLLDRHAILGHVSVNSKRQALQVVADMAARQLGLEAAYIHQALLEREKLGSTGVGMGVAVPHAALKGLDRMYGVFVRLETPVAYDSIDDMPVDLIFALLAPEDAGTEHLRALAKVSRVLRQKDLREQLRAIENPDAIYALLTEMADSNAA
ncbi:PTS IIA-like nitrogen regulatory protein PtsN [Asticcacaulis sp. EMRT-3]|uniref:PTS IIA-like nitrogen regulatory protein PtsN n=1 Tax=Asticcacaulis sp. EMRT-3 TaxID=3040349 RepID=UPI0024AF2DE9|nr:PTS IIA-like nitrogen regulatory protein PtsN [Asticcacaulis sp. EMRT-3]MDI7775881.1 PTS IIA-like nitrogen regulatory protein PtsN [Asticcacaulis sp. EMRT-3]